MTFQTPHTCEYKGKRYSVREPKGVKYPWDIKESRPDGNIGMTMADVSHDRLTLAYFGIPKPGIMSTANYCGYLYGYDLLDDGRLFITSMWTLCIESSDSGNSVTYTRKGDGKLVNCSETDKWTVCLDKDGPHGGYKRFILKDPVEIEYEEISLTSVERLFGNGPRYYLVKDGEDPPPGSTEKELDEKYGAPIIIRSK